MRKKGLTAYELKWIAIVSMAMDHTAYVFYSILGDAAIFMRMIGRFTFPIMAFLLTEGFIYTKNRLRYSIRLLTWALISMAPFYFLFGTVKNVLFTLAAGLCLLTVQDAIQKKRSEIPTLVWQIFFALIAVGVAALMKSFDWGLPGIIAIFLVGQCKRLSYAVQACVCTGSLLFITVLNRVMSGAHLTSSFLIFIAGIPLAAIWIYLYNGKRGKDMRYLFYAFYPIHLLVIALVLSAVVYLQ